jgi:hypothetical protein
MQRSIGAGLLLMRRTAVSRPCLQRLSSMHIPWPCTENTVACTLKQAGAAPVALVDECVEGRALLDDGHCGAQGPRGLNVVKRVPQVVVVVFLHAADKTGAWQAGERVNAHMTAAQQQRKQAHVLQICRHTGASWERTGRQLAWLLVHVAQLKRSCSGA